MFKISLTVNVHYEGCPENGLAAIDWRDSMGLFRKPSNFAFQIKFLMENEKLCRLNPALLDENADLKARFVNVFLFADQIDYLNHCVFPANERTGERETFTDSNLTKELQQILTKIFTQIS